MVRSILVSIALTGFALHPILVCLLAYAVAHAAGCVLSEAGRHPCLIAGRDWGTILLDMMMYFWAVIITAPASAVASGIMVIAWLARRFRHQLKKRSP